MSKRNRNQTPNKALRGKSNSKGNRRECREDKVTGSGENFKGSRLAGPLNDFEWYNRNPLLTAAAASVPYPYRPGMSLNNVELGSDSTYNLNTLAIPGVMSIDWMPTVGKSSGPMDPASMVGKDMFNKVRATYSGSLDADAPDFVIYLMALDSIYSYIEWMIRVYKCVNYYTPDNYFVPDGLLRSMGFTASGIEGIRQNKMQLFQYIVTLTEMIAKIRCPDVFDIVNRHRWMSKHVFTDAPIQNSQWYVFNLRAVYKFATDSNGAGKLATTLVPIESFTSPTTMYNFGLKLIDAFVSGDDTYTISGYLTRSYDAVGQFNIELPQMGERIVPVYAPEVLSQIENLVSIGDEGTSYTWNDVTQNPTTNSVVCNPVDALLKASYPVNFKPTISIRSEAPTVIETIEATRLTTWVDVATGAIECATEIPLYTKIWYTKMPTNTLTSTTISQLQYIAAPPSVDNIIGYLLKTQWDWCPRSTVVFASGTTSPTNKVLWGIQAGDSHNITIIDADVLKNMHTVCLYSEFNSFATYE